MKSIKIYYLDACLELCDKNTKTTGNSGIPVVKFQNKKQIAELWERLQKRENICLITNNIDETIEAFHSYFRCIRAAGGLLQNHRGEWLFIFRNGRWDLPKGKEEEGETPEENALREVTEECGLPGPPASASFLTETFHTYFLEDCPVLKKTTWFRMSLPGPAAMRPQIEEGITRLLWRQPDHLDDIIASTYPSIRDVLTEALRTRTSSC